MMTTLIVEEQGRNITYVLVRRTPRELFVGVQSLGLVFGVRLQEFQELAFGQ